MEWYLVIKGIFFYKDGVDCYFFMVENLYVNLKVLFKYYWVVFCLIYGFFYFKGIVFLLLFVVWLEDFFVDDDGKIFLSLGKELRILVIGLYSVLLLVVV